MGQTACHLTSYAINQVKQREWKVENFRFFYGSVSVMSSSKIEGEEMEVDRCVQYKILNIEYLPNPIDKPNDFSEVYEFA